MYYTIKILILNSLTMMAIFADSQNSKTVYPAEAKKEDIDSLFSYTSKEALPLILFQTKDRTIEFPSGLTKAEIKAGRLIFGTEFHSITSSATQILLCQNSDPRKTCLVPKHFKEEEILKCEREPIPTINPSERRCGSKGNGIILKFEYEICDTQEADGINSKNVIIYSICYDKSTKKILYAVHEMDSVNLLSEKLIVREREVKLEISKETYGQIDSKYSEILINLKKTKSEYEFQMLVPNEDKAFVTWRKPVYHYVNMALQHRNLNNFWNKINGHVRTHAMKSFASTSFGIITGIIELPKELVHSAEKNNKMFNIWIQVILRRNNEITEGLAILMNNFILDKIDDQTDHTSRLKYHYIDQICEINLCLKSLKQDFSKIGGRLCCCKVTEKILKVFDSYENDDTSDTRIIDVLNIQGITLPM